MSKYVKDLRKMCWGFQASRVLMTAVNLEVFDNACEPVSARDLARAIRSDRRATEILLDAVTSIGLLKKQAGKYRNTLISNRCLVRGAPEYQGDIIRHSDSLWHNWSALDEVLITGRPAGRAFDHYSFIMGMHNIASVELKEVMRHIKLKNVKKALDLGCGPGTYGLEMATKGVAVTLFDSPETIKITKKFAARLKIKGIRFLEGDFMHDNIGVGYDLVFISHIFHAYSAQDNAELLEKCHRTMNPGGQMVIQEFYLNRDRARPASGAMFSINMLVNTQAGRSYSPPEMSGWLKSTGFVNIQKIMLGEKVLLIGNKVYQTNSRKPALRKTSCG